MELPKIPFSTERLPSPRTIRRAVASVSTHSISRRFAYKGFAVLIISLLAGAATAAEQSDSNATDTSGAHHSAVRVQVNHQPEDSASSDASAGTNSTSAQTDISTNDVQQTDTSSDSSAQTSNTSNTSVDVSVNGQPVQVPANGSNQQTVTTGDTTTTVNVSNNQSDTGHSFNAEFTTNHVHSRSTDSNSSVNVQSEHSFP
jgi:hypothetical protein